MKEILKQNTYSFLSAFVAASSICFVENGTVFVHLIHYKLLPSIYQFATFINNNRFLWKSYQHSKEFTNSKEIWNPGSSTSFSKAI